MATATLVVAANAPDLDVLSFVHGSEYALAFRRGITHGVPAMLVLPFLVAGAMLVWDRFVRRRRHPDAEPAPASWLLVLSLIGVSSHPLLDWLNSYGMRWWLPFDGRWSFGDSVFIIDPWLWLALGAACYLGGRRSRTADALWATLAALASALVLIAPVPLAARAVWMMGLGLCLALRLRRTPFPSARRQRLALVLTGLAGVYLAAMFGAGTFARQGALEAARLVAADDVVAVMVAPVPADPFRGEIVVRTSAGYFKGSYHWFRTPRAEVVEGSFLPFRSGAATLSAAEVEQAIATAIHAPAARNYLVWSRFPYFRVQVDAGGRPVEVVISDARYDTRGTGSLGGVVVPLP